MAGLSIMARQLRWKIGNFSIQLENIRSAGSCDHAPSHGVIAESLSSCFNANIEFR
jgi:hypothetical protein